MVKVGDVAPDFVLKDQNGEEFRLSDFRGRKVLLSFHPLAWTSICERQMKALEEHYDKLEELNVVPVGISVDSVPTKRHGQSTWALKSSESLRTSGPWGSCPEVRPLQGEGWNLGKGERDNRRKRQDRFCEGLSSRRASGLKRGTGSPEGMN